jgi:hypothetical protein
MATGYRIQGNKMVEAPDNTKSFGWAAPCGALHTSMKDMIEFLRYLITNSPKIVSNSYTSKHLLPGINLAEGASTIGLDTWEIAYMNHRYVITKGGTLTG